MTGFFFARGDIYEDAAHHNAVFVGRDEDGIPRYAHSKGTAGNFRFDVKGSDKAFNFCYRGEGDRLFVFEAPVDLLSFLCLFKKAWQKQSYLSLGGVGEKALLRFLSDRPNIKTVYLCLDSDQAGNDACSRLAELVPEGLTVHRLVPLYKDWNEVLQHRAEITDGKYIREAVYGLKEPPQEETVEIIRMSEVDTQTVEWLWEPYIPFGKVTIVQGNPGEGKTTFALRLAAACTTGGTLPGMKPLPPFQVIYQTAEDGLGDTVKPRLIEAEADLDRVLVIDEAKRELIGSLCPTQHRIKAEAVLTLIADMLRAIAEYSKNDRSEFIRTVQETQAAQQTADISKKRKRLAAAQKRAGELERLICKIYEDNALGKLPDARYEALDAQYAKEQEALNAEIAELEKAVTGYEQSRKSAEKFIALIDKYENFDTLTNTMLNEFVEKILVHERARKGSQDTTQEVEIYFNFVGRYIPPALQPVPLTPEEQEELRKKEERKDRLHQNYLRRKANGKQKEWEERYNAKRKAKVEAAKAAIRAEDMEKGIFIPVSQLPRQEPHKATVSASAAV